MAVRLSHVYGTPTTQRPTPPLTGWRTTASQVRAVLKSGKVQAIRRKEASTAIDSEGLDIRPAWEWEKARVRGSMHVPLFVKDEDNCSMKKWVQRTVAWPILDDLES